MPYERLYICSHPLWPYHRTSLGQYMYFLLKKLVILQFFSSTEKRIAMGTRSFGKKISIGKVSTNQDIRNVQRAVTFMYKHEEVFWSI